MVDLAIGGAISGLKAAAEIARSFLDVRDQVLIQGKVIELQSVILAAQSDALAAQSEQFALLDDKRRLEAKIADLEAWAREKQRYVLEEIEAGRFGYALKPEAQGGEPPHFLCQRCYEDGHKSILQHHHSVAARVESMRCPRCTTEIRLGSG